MNIFVVIVVLALPGSPGKAELTAEVARELITASSAQACQKHADKRAEEIRSQSSGIKGRVYGVCIKSEAP